MAFIENAPAEREPENGKPRLAKKSKTSGARAQRTDFILTYYNLF